MRKFNLLRRLTTAVIPENSRSGFIRNPIFLLVALLSLSACTLIRPPAPDLPRYVDIIPGKKITVKGNENIYSIAHANNVSMREIIVLNHLKPPFDVRRGQKIILPAGGSSFTGDLEPPESSPLEPVTKSTLPPLVGVEVTSEELPPPSTAKTNLKTSGFSSPQPQATETAPSKPAEADKAQAVEKEVETKPVAEETSSYDSSDSSMRWPVQGPILSGFGPKKGGMKNDGINIGAPKGSPVVASAAGTVVYVGNDMKGFGNMILIKHYGDMVTAYAHLARILVKKNAVVSQGDMIGTVGKTGNVATPQLHFEIRRDGKPTDPTKIIGD
ncbi:MAG: M23 family metallopeptidase [Bdellovibrionales bacterium]